MNADQRLILDKLKSISTATIATSLFKIGLRNQYIQGVLPLGTLEENMVGIAYTLRYIPAREDLNPITVFQDPKHLQRVAVEECPKGHVLIIDSRQNPKAASAGSLLIGRLQQRGVAGIVTDGGFRDCKEIEALGFPTFQSRPSAPTNLTLHQAIALNEPIGCGEVAVFPGDYIVGDQDGVMVIPSEKAKAIVENCIQMTQFEQYVEEQIAKGESIIGLYPMTDPKKKAAFEKWKSPKTKR